jgi:hypothetical protein
MSKILRRSSFSASDDGCGSLVSSPWMEERLMVVGVEGVVVAAVGGGG